MYINKTIALVCIMYCKHNQRSVLCFMYYKQFQCVVPSALQAKGEVLSLLSAACPGNNIR